MPMFNLARKRGKAKIKISNKRKAVMNQIVDTYSEEFDIRLSVIRNFSASLTSSRLHNYF